ncbi:hypothetical protein [Spirosoma arcticum]
MNDKQPHERTCPICSTVFISAKPTRKFCSNNCRSASDRFKQKQKTKDLAKQVEQQNTQLAKEKERVIPLAKVSNSHWQAADLLCQAQQARCTRIEQALEENKDATRALTRPGENYQRGWAIGVFLALILVSIWFKAYRRRNRTADTTFWLVSLGGVVLSGWLVAQRGKEVDDDRTTSAQEEALHDDLEEQQQEKDVLTTALKQAKARLNELYEARDKLDPFAADSPPTTPEDEDPLSPTDPT